LATPEHILKFWEFYQAPDTERWTLDEYFLSRYIYPLVKDRTRIHASYNRYEKWATDMPRTVIINGKTIVFPSRKIGFCGMTITYLPNASKKFNLEKTSYKKKRVK
jgi:hypothetical protein